MQSRVRVAGSRTCIIDFSLECGEPAPTVYLVSGIKNQVSGVGYWVFGWVWVSGIKTLVGLILVAFRVVGRQNRCKGRE